MLISRRQASEPLTIRFMSPSIATTAARAAARGATRPLWENARVVMPPPGKSSIHLRVDTDVLQWFKAQGRGHLSRMNAVLRSFMEAQKQHPR
jgi:uncharacterized protein (DUF4415 family)